MLRVFVVCILLVGVLAETSSDEIAQCELVCLALASYCRASDVCPAKSCDPDDVDVAKVNKCFVSAALDMTPELRNSNSTKCQSELTLCKHKGTASVVDAIVNYVAMGAVAAFLVLICCCGTKGSGNGCDCCEKKRPPIAYNPAAWSNTAAPAYQMTNI